MRSNTACGIIVPSITVFREDEEQSIDEQKTADHIDWLIRNGVDAIVPAGSSGEFPAFTMEESKQLFRLAIDVANGRVPVYPAACRYATRDVIELTIAAEKAGASGVMVIVPYYMKPGPAEIMEHFRAVRRNTDLPIILYNNPATTGVELAHDDIVTLIDEGVVNAVKSSQGNVETSLRLALARPHARSYYGHDVDAQRALGQGAHGWFSLFPNAFPHLAKRVEAEAKEGRAPTTWKRLLPCIDFVWGGSAHPIAAVKAMLEIQGRFVGSPRRPLHPCSGSVREDLAALVSRVCLEAGGA